MRSFRTVIFSLAFHLFLAWLLTQLPPLDLHPFHRETVEWLDTSKMTPQDKAKDDKLFDDEKSFVRAAKPPKELLTDVQKPARFSSEDKQNVLEEVKAHNSGLTANRDGENFNAPTHQAQEITKHEKTRAKPMPTTKLSREKLNLNPNSELDSALSKDIAESKKPTQMLGDGANDLRVGGLNRGGTAATDHGNKRQDPSRSESEPLQLPNFMGAERGASTVGEQLPDDIKFGAFTALNTDRNLFYSFYSRLEEVVRPPWVRYARASLYAYETGAKKLQGNETWTTKVEVLLDKDGNYIRAIIHEGSGITSLDQAPVEAFRQSRQFPHPPPEMIKADGMIHIYCMFTVNVGPQYASGGAGQNGE